MLNLLIPSYAELKGFGPSAHEDCNRLWIYWTAWLQPRKNMCGVPGIWVVWMESNTWIINRIRRQEYLHFFKVPLAAHRDLKNPPDLQKAPSLCKVIPAFHVLVQLQKSWNNWQHVWLLGWKIQVLNLCLAFSIPPQGCMAKKYIRATGCWRATAVGVAKAEMQSWPCSSAANDHGQVTPLPWSSLSWDCSEKTGPEGCPLSLSSNPASDSVQPGVVHWRLVPWEVLVLIQNRGMAKMTLNLWLRLLRWGDYPGYFEWALIVVTRIFTGRIQKKRRPCDHTASN